MAWDYAELAKEAAKRGGPLALRYSPTSGETSPACTRRSNPPDLPVCPDSKPRS